MRDAVRRRAFHMAVPTDRHIKIEFDVIPAAMKTFIGREWTVLTAPPGSPGFVTSDSPVSLRGIKPPAHPMPVGHALPGTEVLFAISSHIAVIGRFGEGRGRMDLSELEVAMVNSTLINSAHRQVYARGDDFLYFSGLPRIGADLTRDPLFIEADPN